MESCMTVSSAEAAVHTSSALLGFVEQLNTSTERVINTVFQRESSKYPLQKSRYNTPPPQKKKKNKGVNRS